MPRFFFNVYDGTSYTDEVGCELADWDEARSRAVASACEIIRDSSQRRALGEDWRMEVTDATGLILFRVDFRLLESPAMMGPLRNRTDAK